MEKTDAMSEWKEYRLGDLIDEIAMGPFGSNIKVECFVDSGVPVLNGSNLQGFRLNESTYNYVTPQKADSLGRANALRGDVVITHRGTLGQIVFIPDDSKYERYVISQSQFRVKFKKDIDSQFIVYFFHSRNGQHLLLTNASQVGVPAIARPSTSFKELKAILPPLSVQKKIAAILSSLDEKIETNRKINARLEELAQALFKSWFIDFEPFGGKMPEDWTTSAAENFFTIDIGKTPPRKETQWFSCRNNDVAWISISDMGKSGMFISTSSEMITEDAKTKFNIVTVPKNTILLSFKLTIGRVSIANTELTTNEAIARFRLNNFIEREFLYLFLKEYDYNSLGSTSSIAVAVNSKIIKRMPITMPTRQVLYEFSMLVCPLFDRIESLTKESARLATLRDTLLPKLMSGEIISE